MIGVNMIEVGGGGGVRVSDTGLDTRSSRVGRSNSSGYGGGQREFAGHGTVWRERAGSSAADRAR